MREEEKQALIGLCRIEIKRWKSIADRQRGGFMVELMEIALASLTAEPVAWRHNNGPFGKIATCSENAAKSWKSEGFDISPLYTIPPVPAVTDGWIKCSDRMPDHKIERRVCVYTPTPHEDMRYRFVHASLFKSVCSSATHWHYMEPPVPEDE